MLPRLSAVLLVWCRLFGVDVCLAECVQVPELRYGDIDVMAFDVRGEKLEGVEAELLDAKTLKTITRSRQSRFEHIRYGEYRVRVWVQGFYASEAPVRLYEPALAVRTQLSIGEECRAFLTIAGQLISDKPKTGLWVKIVPVYGSGGFETPVGTTGTFVASGLDAGQFLLMVMQGSAVLHSEAVTVRSGTLTTRVKIDLTAIR